MNSKSSYCTPCANADSPSVPTKDPSVEETAAVSLITPQDFHLVRSYLEQFDDIAILADVVGIATSSLDPSVLASATDTLNYHVKAFRAIGAFDPLFGRIAMRYAVIRTTRFPERELLLSVQNVARTVRPDAQLLQLLSYDLSRLDQKNSMAACSPASDNMGEALQYTGSRHDDDIERILSSGTSMDQLMMARVVRKIISNLEMHVAKGHSQSDSYPAWFWRLRSFDEPAFDVVLHDWLASCLIGHESNSLRIAVPILVGSGCMALSSLLDSLRCCLDEYKQIESTSAFPAVIAGLRVLILPDDLARFCSPQDAYRYRLEQYKLCYGTDASIVHCIKRVVETAPTTLSPICHQELSTLLCSEPVVAIVRHHIIYDTDLLSKLKREHAHPRPSGTYLNGIINSLLDPTGRSCKWFNGCNSFTSD
jgi:mediator of RNA polymerase II transcription subunit 12